METKNKAKKQLKNTRFFFYSQKQVFENKKQKLLPNITLDSSFVCLFVIVLLIKMGVPRTYNISLTRKLLLHSLKFYEP